MSLVVFTGGTRSGKSTAAQDLARRRQLEGAHVVVAVFGRDSDAEMAERIARHGEYRPEGFETLAAQDLVGWLTQLGDGDLLVVDCLGTLVGRVMEEVWESAGERLETAGDVVSREISEAVIARVGAVVDSLLARSGDTIVVTNEVGDGVVPGFASGRVFRDVMGSANRRLINRADAAYLCVAGRLIDVAGLPRSAPWPED